MPVKYAQTNLQLYDQLHQAGYNQDDFLRVADAYKLAMRLFAGKFRPSDKTFLAHLVGTSSIVASTDARIEVVIAALLHAVYDEGDFGDFSKGVSHQKRAQVRSQVGADVEALVARYSAIKWWQGAETIKDSISNFATLPQIDREALIIRLANELEEYLDCGLYYCAGWRQERSIAVLRSSADGIAELSALLGVDLIGRQLLELSGHHAEHDDAVFQPSAPAGSSYTLAPQSYRPAIRMVCRSIIGGSSRRLLGQRQYDRLANAWHRIRCGWRQA